MNLFSRKGRRLLSIFALVFVCQHTQATDNKSLTNILYTPLKEPATEPLPYVWSKEERISNFNIKERNRYAKLAIKSEFRIFRKKLSINLDQKIIYDVSDVAISYNLDLGEEFIRNVIAITKFQSPICATYLSVLYVDEIGWDFSITKYSHQEPIKVIPFIALEKGVKLRLLELAEEYECKNSAAYLKYLSKYVTHKITEDTKVYKKLKDQRWVDISKHVVQKSVNRRK